MDFTYAKREFRNYLKHYDCHDDKIRLKIVHTYGVVEDSTKIASRMRLSREDLFLAQLIALLHDIGRFEQLRQFDSFLPDTMDHAAYGVQLLFGEEQMIRLFLKENHWDSIIRTAIEKHSDFQLEGIKDPRTLLHAQLIRDADKLDNCRVKLEERLETFMNASPEEIGSSEISEKVADAARNRRCILSSDRVTPMDYWVSYLAYFYDINFRETFAIIEEEDYVRRIIARVPYTNPKTKAFMELLEEDLLQYVETISS